MELTQKLQSTDKERPCIKSLITVSFLQCLRGISLVRLGLLEITALLVSILISKFAKKRKRKRGNIAKNGLDLELARLSAFANKDCY